MFPDEYGAHTRSSQYYKAWIRYRDHVGIQAKASPYELRHTFVSITKGLPVGLIKPLVGHSKDMDTFGVYGHEVEGETDTTAALILEAFNKFLPTSGL